MSTRIPLQLISNNNTPIYYTPYESYAYEENVSYPWMEFNENFSYSMPAKKKSSNRRSKHVPHHLRPAHLVEQRNTRERQRVHDVNQAFHILQTLLPFDENNPAPSSRISKLRTLRTAVDYIEALQQILDQTRY